MDKEIPVLIVGAGPTGLMMGCLLARYGIPFRIIDKKSEPTPSSNATWIQTLTIELLSHLNLAEKFFKISNPCNALHFYVDGHSIGKISLQGIDSLYQYVLLLPQSETEKILTQDLVERKIPIERSTQLVAVKQSKNLVTAEVKSADGNKEMITTRYLIACDGANSTIREKCKMFFPGEDLTEQFVVADAIIESYMSKDELHGFFSQGEIFAAFPLGTNRYRITANLHLPVSRKHYYKNEIIEMAQERAHGAYYIKDVSWISTFWIHGKIIKQMRKGLIFFAGDAAHIHSPLGGQGMNTGLQDVYNLAWKIAAVLQGQAKPSLLNSYHAERYPVIKKIVKNNNTYTKLMIAEKTFSKKLAGMIKKINKPNHSLAKKIAMELTQLNIQYLRSPIIKYNQSKSDFIKPGQHAPNVKITDKRTLYECLDNTKHNILIFSGLAKKNNLSALIELKNMLDKNFSDTVKTHIISLENTSQAIHDLNSKLHQYYNATKAHVLILRPDHYIAYSSSTLAFPLIKKFLKKYLRHL